MNPGTFVRGTRPLAGWHAEDSSPTAAPVGALPDAMADHVDRSPGRR